MADEHRSDDRYDIVLSPQTRRALSETLAAGAAFAVFEFIDGPLADNPRRVGAPLRAPFAGYHRARRAGDAIVRPGRSPDPSARSEGVEPPTF